MFPFRFYFPEGVESKSELIGACEPRRILLEDCLPGLGLPSVVLCSSSWSRLGFGALPFFGAGRAVRS